MKKIVKSTGNLPWALNSNLKMKLLVMFLLTINFVMQANNSYTELTKISLDMSDTTVERVMNEIESTTEFKFFFNNKIIDMTRKVSIKVKRTPVQEVLLMLFEDEYTSIEIGHHKILLNEGNVKSKLEVWQTSESTGVQYTQQQQITDTVTDNNGEPLIGANVIEKSTINGVTTDFDGNFSITVSENATLEFSSLGFEVQAVAVVPGQTTLNVVLQEGAAALDEVVVIGYGTQKRSKEVSAIDQVSSAAFEGRASVNTTQALQGQSPSLTIQQTNSEPGAGININILGISTLGSNSPLIVIDGIIGGDINTLNPADIESVSVLKDAGSAAIYGSRASNGVVLITTKKGSKNSPMTVQYNSLEGFNLPHYFTSPVHGYENAMLRNEAAFNSNESSAIYTAAQIAQFEENGDEKWFADEIVKDALQ